MPRTGGAPTRSAVILADLTALHNRASTGHVRLAGTRSPRAGSPPRSHVCETLSRPTDSSDAIVDVVPPGRSFRGGRRDALLHLRRRAPGEIFAYLARREGAGWVVAFGRPDSVSGHFHVAYEAVQVPSRTDSFTVTRHAPARVDSDRLASAARAFSLARADFGTRTRPYNTAVLPASDSGWFVYLMPARTEHGVFPLGGDVRYHVSPDGRRILVKRQLHNAILDMAVPSDTLPALLSTTPPFSTMSPRTLMCSSSSCASRGYHT